MTENQIKYLKMLGYTDTQEDGAILQHDKFAGMSAYIWQGAKFEEVLSEYAVNLEVAVTHKIVNTIKLITLS